jgi:hypothetical protein
MSKYVFCLGALIMLADLANAIFKGGMSSDGSFGFGMLAAAMLIGSAALKVGFKE